MNLEYPDHDKSCDDRSSSTEAQCLSLRNPFRFDFNINGNRGVIVERHSLCAWDHCSQSCYAAKPDEDAATQVSHFLLLLVVFWATIPYCRCVMWLVETYLLAPSPWAKEAEVEYDPEAASQEILARCDGPAPAWWPTAGNTGAPPAPELYLSDGTPRAEDDELIWPDSDEEDQDWIDGIVERLRAKTNAVEIDENVRTVALTDRKTNRRRDVLKTSKVTDTDRRRAERLAPAVAAAIVARATELELRAREAEVLRARDSVGAQDAAVVMRAVRRSLLADWDYVDNQEAWEYRVAERVAKHLARARKWEEEMAAVGDDDKARVFDDMVRRERLRRVRYRVASEASKRMDETLEAPEAVSAWSYVLAWSVVVALQLFFCYYLISTGSRFGLRKSRVWLSLTCEAASAHPSPRWRATASIHFLRTQVSGTGDLLPRREAAVCVLLLYRGAVAARQDPDRGARSEEAWPARPGPAVRDRIAHGRDVLHPGKASRSAGDAGWDHYPGRAGSLSWCHRRARVRARDPRDRTGAALLSFAPRLTGHRSGVLLPARGGTRDHSRGNSGRPARVRRLRGTPHRDAGEERGPGRGARPRRCGSLLRRPLPAGVLRCVRVPLVP